MAGFKVDSLGVRTTLVVLFLLLANGTVLVTAGPTVLGAGIMAPLLGRLLCGAACLCDMGGGIRNEPVLLSLSPGLWWGGVTDCCGVTSGSSCDSSTDSSLDS